MPDQRQQDEEDDDAGEDVADRPAQAFEHGQQHQRARDQAVGRRFLDQFGQNRIADRHVERGGSADHRGNHIVPGRNAAAAPLARAVNDEHQAESTAPARR